MEKTALLRVRVSPRIKTDFEDICKTYGGKQPSDMLRELVDDFVKTNSNRLSDRVVVHISRPEGYDLGAWRVFIKLRNPEEAIWHGSSVPFSFPSFKKRRLVSDREYQSVVVVSNNETSATYDLGGVFIDGKWSGHLYSNGIEEAENPTSIDEVTSGLVDHITKHLEKFKRA